MATEKELAIRRAVEELDKLTSDPVLQRILDNEELARMDEDVLRRQAIREGHEQGMREGMQEGRKVEKIETAKKLKENGVSIDIIVASTGLTKEEVEEL